MRDLAVEHLRPFRLELHPALRQRHSRPSTLRRSPVSTMFGCAVDDVDAGLAEAVQIQRVPLAVGLLGAASLMMRLVWPTTFGGALRVDQLGLRDRRASRTASASTMTPARL